MNTTRIRRRVSAEKAHPRISRAVNTNDCGWTMPRTAIWITAILLALIMGAAQAQTPRSAKDYLDRGAARYSAGDFDGAIADFANALEINSGHIKLRGRSRKTQNFTEHERAVAHEQIVVNDSFNAIAYYDRGAAWYSKGDLERAMSDFDKAIRIDPGYADAYIKRANVCQVRGDFDRAIADYDRAIKVDPRSALARNNRGIARENKGDMAGAIADFDAAIHLDPRLASAYMNRGVARYTAGDVAGALSDLDTAVAIDPRNAAAYNNRASVRRAGGDLAGAIASHDRAIRIDPNDAVAYMNRGLTLMRQGRTPEAHADFQRALVLKPALRGSIEAIKKGEEDPQARRSP